MEIGVLTENPGVSNKAAARRSIAAEVRGGVLGVLGPSSETANLIEFSLAVPRVPRDRRLDVAGTPVRDSGALVEASRFVVRWVRESGVGLENGIFCFSSALGVMVENGSRRLGVFGVEPVRG